MSSALVQHLREAHDVDAEVEQRTSAQLEGEQPFLRVDGALHPEIGVPLVLDDGVHRSRSGTRRAISRPFGLYP